MFRIQLVLLGCIVLHILASSKDADLAELEHWKGSGYLPAISRAPWDLGTGRRSERDLREDEDESVLRSAFLHILERQAGSNGLPQGDDDGECQPLEGLLEKLLTSSHWPTLIDYMGGLAADTPGTDRFWRRYKPYLGEHDLGLPKDRHAFSCLVYDTSNIKELLVKFGRSDKEIEKFLKGKRDFFNRYDGIKGLEALTDMAYEFGTWAVKTGYPKIPLKRNVTKAELKAEIEKWQHLYYSINMEDVTRKGWDKELQNHLIPMHLNPDYAARTITEAKSLRQLSEGLCMGTIRYRYFIIRKMGKVIVAYSSIWRLGLDILRHLESRGFFQV